MTHTTTPNSNSSNGTGHASTGAAPLSSPIVAALEAAWAAIQDRHPEVPDVVIVLASGSVGAPRGALKLGHFAAMRWTHTSQASTRTAGALPEVFVGGEGLALGAVDVLGTLLHEATHALAHVRGIKDTSRQGRYHSRKFRDLAEEIGLEVREVPVIGWSDTHVPTATREAYATTLDALTAALTLHRRAEGALVVPTGEQDEDGEQPGTTATGGTTSRNGSAALCGCGRRIRVAPSVLALGPITCGVCGQPFTADAPTETDDADSTSGEDGDQDGGGS